MLYSATNHTVPHFNQSQLSMWTNHSSSCRPITVQQINQPIKLQYVNQSIYSL